MSWVPWRWMTTRGLCLLGQPVARPAMSRSQTSRTESLCPRRAGRSMHRHLPPSEGRRTRTCRSHRALEARPWASSGINRSIVQNASPDATGQKKAVPPLALFQDWQGGQARDRPLPGSYQEYRRRLFYPGALDDREVAINGWVDKSLDFPARRRPRDFEFIDFGVRSDSQHITGIVR